MSLRRLVLAEALLVKALLAEAPPLLATCKPGGDDVLAFGGRGCGSAVGLRTSPEVAGNAAWVGNESASEAEAAVSAVDGGTALASGSEGGRPAPSLNANDKTVATPAAPKSTSHSGRAPAGLAALDGD